MGHASSSWYSIPTSFNPGPSRPLFVFKWEVRTGWRCAPKDRFKPCDNRDVPGSCPIDVKFAASAQLKTRFGRGSPSSPRKI